MYSVRATLQGLKARIFPSPATFFFKLEISNLSLSIFKPCALLLSTLLLYVQCVLPPRCTLSTDAFYGSDHIYILRPALVRVRESKLNSSEQTGKPKPKEIKLQ